ncbi:MAG: InlB B-repeat-containing protein [Acutalibacteraceae bacterium]|nr:InlB B-repeat-containing protein [Acutalibacteraceae bacterium]
MKNVLFNEKIIKMLRISICILCSFMMLFSLGVNSHADSSYIVRYDANGGSGAPATQIKYYNQTLVLTEKKPTRTGYTFLGWSTNKTSTKPTYYAGGNYVANSSATLYAVWEKTKYYVRYNANGGSGAPATQIKYYGETLKISSNIPVKSRHNFLGWSTSSSDDAVAYYAGGSYNLNSDITLYAVWGNNDVYNIYYNANGGSGGPGSQTKYYDQVLTISTKIPTRSGYTFLGWSTSKTSTYPTYYAGSNYTANSGTTLYAVWKKNSASTKNTQSISGVKSATYTLGKPAFYLKAKASGNGKLSYSSSNKKVATVSSTGKISIKGCGKATITIKAASTAYYNSTSKKIVITVKPKKPVITSIKRKSSNKKILTWKKDSSVSGYKVSVPGGRPRYRKPSENFFILVGTKGKKYTIEICSYKIVSGTRYYSDYVTKTVKF